MTALRAYLDALPDVLRTYKRRSGVRLQRAGRPELFPLASGVDHVDAVEACGRVSHAVGEPIYRADASVVKTTRVRKDPRRD